MHHFVGRMSRTIVEIDHVTLRPQREQRDASLRHWIERIVAGG